MLRARAHADALASLASDPSGLRAYWQRLGDADRLQPVVAEAAARAFLAMGGDREAAELIERASSATGMRSSCSGTPSATAPIRRASSRRPSAG